jgi:hypothetical protein
VRAVEVLAAEVRAASVRAVEVLSVEVLSVEVLAAEVAGRRAADGAGDGAGGVTSLPPELDWKPPFVFVAGSRMEKGRGDAGFYSPGPLVPVGNLIWD